jgi:hypothetical protein
LPSIDNFGEQGSVHVRAIGRPVAKDWHVGDFQQRTIGLEQRQRLSSRYQFLCFCSLPAVLGETEEAAKRPDGGAIGQPQQSFAQRVGGATVLQRQGRGDRYVMRDNGGAGAWLSAIEKDLGKPAIGEARDRRAVANAFMFEGKDFAASPVPEGSAGHGRTSPRCKSATAEAVESDRRNRRASQAARQSCKLGGS